jgi:predicted permease
MGRLRAVFLRLLDPVRRHARERELHDELEAHLELHIRDNLRAGVSPADARRAALLKLGGLESVKEQYRERRGFPVVDILARDVRQAARMLRKSPGFTAVAVLSLALGIGVNTTMFSVVNAVLLRALPYPEPAQLVRIVQRDGKSDVAYSDYTVVEQQSRSFSAVAAHRGAGDRRLDWGSAHDWISTIAVTSGFLRTLGVHPAMGREFVPDETQRNGAPAVILSDSLWRRSFGADPSIVGRTVTLDGAPFAIVGVLPADFWFPQRADALVPLRPTGGLSDLGTNTQVLARLRTTVNLEPAQAEMDALIEPLRRARAGNAPDNYRGLSALSYHDWLVGDVRLNLLLLFGATGVLLLISCGNLAMLLMTRLAARGKEIALRVALGSSRRRLFAQFLVENLVVAALGAGASVLTAYALLGGLVAWMPFNLPAATPVRLDGAVLAFALGVALATAVIFTLVPLFLTKRLNVQEALASAGRTPGADGIRARTRNLLVIGEVALSTTLLIAAGLLIQSLYRTQQERLGFVPHGLVTFATPVDRDRIRTPADRVRFTRELRDRLERLPGVLGVAAANVLPLAGRSNLPVQREGHPEHSVGGMEIRLVTPDYFEILGIPIRRGRAFTMDDVASSPPVAMVNDTVARTWWRDGDAIGDRLIIGLFQGRRLTNDPPRQVVGIAGDTKTTTLKDPPRPTVFVPMEQVPADASSLTWIVKTDGPAGLAANVRAAVAGVDPAQRVLQIRTMDEIVESTTATSRFNASLFAIFASVALVLAVVGLYGVLSFLVGQRRHEIGTRLALGASRQNVAGLFLAEGMRLTAAGLGLGLTAALLLTRWLSTLLYGVRPDDPASFAGVAILLLCVGLAASYLPARRAAGTDPMAALRSE